MKINVYDPYRFIENNEIGITCVDFNMLKYSDYIRSRPSNRWNTPPFSTELMKPSPYYKHRGAIIDEVALTRP